MVVWTYRLAGIFSVFEGIRLLQSLEEISPQRRLRALEQVQSLVASRSVEGWMLSFVYSQTGLCEFLRYIVFW